MMLALGALVVLLLVVIVLLLWTLYRVQQIGQQAVLTNVLIQQGQEVITRIDKELH